MKKHVFVALMAALFPLSASADVLDYSKCTVNPGKTMADVEAAFTAWRTVSKDAGFGDYKIRLLIPHADTDTQQTTFWLEGSSPNFERYGKAYEWWYTNPDAAKSNASLQQAFSCESQVVFRSGASFE